MKTNSQKQWSNVPNPKGSNNFSLRGFTKVLKLLVHAKRMICARILWENSIC
uniref:Uncharacterized protein n=1 Tax=Arundo donax TaxID=35708 RepID=A0A0A8YSI6_ARUDO